jgi:putative two-component system response regulator
MFNNSSSFLEKLYIKSSPMKNPEKHTFLNYALLITGTHHEKWDGTGYPVGLKHRNIPLEGRLMAIADVYDALIAVRPYKKALAHEEACRIITDGSGTHFDPVLVEIFNTVKGDFEMISQKKGVLNAGH